MLIYFNKFNGTKIDVLDGRIAYTIGLEQSQIHLYSLMTSIDAGSHKIFNYCEQDIIFKQDLNRP